MRAYYGYEEIKNLKVKLSWQVDRIHDKPFISREMQELAYEIDKLLISYNKILNNLKLGEKVTDIQIVQGFNETEIYIYIISNFL